MKGNGHHRRVLVAGVGNVFLGDDGFGCEVARQLAGESWPGGVHVEDYGIRGVHLAYKLLEGFDTLILIDAARHGEAPGTIFVLEPELGAGESASLLDAHSLDPEMVLTILKDLGGDIARVILVGCEPVDLEERMGLSDTVANAVGTAAAVVRDLIVHEASGPDPMALGMTQEEGT